MPDRIQSSGLVPVPDPTKLTTDAVSLAKEELKELFDTKLTGFRELVIEKFTGRDTALAAALKSAQELVKQQNDSNTLAFDKAALATTKQIDAAVARIDDLKERIGRSENALGQLQGRALALAGFGAVFGAALGAMLAKAIH